MTLTLPARSTLLFQGDSVTDGQRLADPEGLGIGYVRAVTELLRAAHPDAHPTVLNRGVNGHRAADLRTRWETDAIALRPDLVSIMIGVNDTWRRYDSGLVTTAEAYEKDYRHMLARLRDETAARIVLVEPFLVPVTEEQWSWRADLDPRIQVVRRLAADFGARLLAADGLMNQAARTAGAPELIAFDGIHPTALGHQVLAAAWTGLITFA